MAKGSLVGSGLDVVDFWRWGGEVVGNGWDCRELWIFNFGNVLFCFCKDFSFEVHEPHGLSHFVSIVFFYISWEFGVDKS